MQTCTEYTNRDDRRHTFQRHRRRNVDLFCEWLRKCGLKEQFTPKNQAVQDVDEFVSSSDLEKCSIKIIKNVVKLI